MTNQSTAQKIEKEIDCKVIIIYGKMRNGKTLLAGCIGYNDFYPRIYSNFHIYHEGKSVVNYLETFQQIDRIRFSYTHGVIIIDEGGINVNSKDGFSETSRMMQKVLFLAGKKNCSVIFIAQRYNSVDVNFRELADLILECRKIPRKNTYPTFNVIKRKQVGNQLKYQESYDFDAIGMMKALGISYDTLETSTLGNEKKDPKGKGKNEIVTNRYN